ncbi:MAG: sigma-70 family RNA polymerase sigma factor [Candidatus Omnitrophota bacterium]
MIFNNLIIPIMPKLKAIAKRLNRNNAYFDHDDLLQEALLYLWDKNRKNELSAKTQSYILQGCFFYLKNYIRKSQKSMDKKTIPIDKDSFSFVENYLSKGSANLSQRKISIGLLLQTLNQTLLPKEKEVLRLSLRGFTKRKIGEKLGVSHVMVIKIEKKIRKKSQFMRRELIHN